MLANEIDGVGEVTVDVVDDGPVLVDLTREAPVVVVEVTDENRRPGGAGNVVNNLICLGADVSVCGLVGDDKDGRELVSMLQALGADVSGILVDRSRHTSVKTRVIAHGQQVVRVDREDRHPLNDALAEGIAGAVGSQIEKVAGIIVSDYAKGTVSPKLFDRLHSSYEKGLLGFGKVPVLVDPKAPNYSLYKRATVIKPNRLEAESGSGIISKDTASAVEAVQALLKKWESEMIRITLGIDGMYLLSKVKGRTFSSLIVCCSLLVHS